METHLCGQSKLLPLADFVKFCLNVLVQRTENEYPLFFWQALFGKSHKRSTLFTEVTLYLHSDH